MSRFWIAVGAALAGFFTLACGPALAQFHPGGPGGMGGPMGIPCPPNVDFQLSAVGVSGPVAKTSGKHTSEQRIQIELNKKTELDFIETPLAEVAHYISKRHNIPVRLDRRTMEDLGLTPDQLITCQEKGVTLGSALKRILGEFDLTYTVTDEVLFITSIEEETGMLRRIIYDVSDLILSVPPNIQGVDTTASDQKALESLVQLITTQIEPDRWPEKGGEGQISSGIIGPARVLVVTQSYHVQEEINSFLQDLHRVAAGSKARQPGWPGFVPPPPVHGLGEFGGFPPGEGPSAFLGGPGPMPGMGEVPHQPGADRLKARQLHKKPRKEKPKPAVSEDEHNPFE